MVILDLDDNCGYHHDLGNLHIANPHDIHVVNPMIDPIHHHFLGGFPTAPSHGRLWCLPCLVCHGPWHAISCYRTLKYGTLADQVGDLWLPEEPEGGLDDDEKSGMAALVNPRSYLDIAYECSE